MKIINIENITLKRAGKYILKDISLEAEEGEVFAFLGENGAGKTSIFEVLTGVIRPDSGKLSFYGDHKVDDIKERLGVLWDNQQLFPSLKVAEILNYFSILHGKNGEINKEFLDVLELEPLLGTQMSSLSKGQKRRVEIILACIHDPNILILDEPTAELDPMIRKIIWEKIFLQKGRTIFFSTHSWEEAILYANKIVLIYKGIMLCKPKSALEIMDDYSFLTKISLSREMEFEMNEPCISFFEEGKRNFLFEQKNAEMIFSRLRETQNSYSEEVLGLKDVYSYLSKSIEL